MDFVLGSAKSMLIFFFILRICAAIDTISPTQSITDGNTIVSEGGKFELGFFNPGNSTNRYVGIWYNKVPNQTVVWVANRENPLTDSSGILAISSGNLVLLDGRLRVLWSTNHSIVATNLSAKLWDSGNLVLSGLNYENNGIVLWQSFDYPTDTLLPDMKLGMNLKAGLNWTLTSWKSPNDPARGEFSYVLDPRGSPQFFLIQGSRRYARSGPWNGLRLSGVPQMNPDYVINYSYVDNGEEIYYKYALHNDSIISRLILDGSGSLKRLTWFDNGNRWNLFWAAPADQCDPYATCGANGICTANEASWCACLRGFIPKSPQDWYLRDESGGCIRSRPLECGNGDGFVKVERAKLPDTSGSQVIPNSNLADCQKECLNNCSCTAYASASIIGGGDGCLIWYGDLIDLRVFSDSGQDVYIRLVASELDASPSEDGNKRSLVIALVTGSLGILLLVSFGYFFWWKKNKGQAETASCSSRLRNLGTNRSGIKDTSETIELEQSSHGTELPVYDLDTVAAATNNFSSENKLGEGGFGPVYKGMLAKGEEIAVKRLSRYSGQGREEFKNEVMLIAKLQHRNLVKLLGCCVQGDERMLIYEYMPNKSLDCFIFDRSRRVLLNWRKRFSIIDGIARGILYLHQDSRLRIIHRDLKASNILLDAEMNPKISDFGMARIFGGNQTQANTNRVVGTHGYMAPEYAMDGFFSVKSDVFSFGVLLLEMVSGRKNSGYYHDDPDLNLLGHVWNMWRDGRGLEILDSSMTGSCSATEVLRCIHVGLLCVQESSADRPTMSSVLSLLTNETAVPPPKQPAFSMKKTIDDRNSSTSGTGSHSINDVTVTAIQGR